MKYKCSKCSRIFNLEEMTKIVKQYQNGSKLTTYLCGKCKEAEA